MTSSEWAIGIATLVLTIIAGVISFDYVNRRFPVKPAQAEQAAVPDAKVQTDSASVTSPGACTEADGSWRNWSWPNVPMLSPKCEGAK